MTMTAEQLARLREVATNLKDVARHSVDGYGRQDIHYNDPEGEFVFYSDYATLLDELERKETEIIRLSQKSENDPRIHEIVDLKERIAELEARTVTVKLPHQFKTSMYGTPLYEQCDILAMLADAGINLTVEG